MGEIPQEKQFHFRDGASAHDLESLKEKIETIAYDEFYGHVNEEKNDFAAWVEGVLEDHDLAEKLRAVTSIVETVELLNERLYPEQLGLAEEALMKEGVPDFQERIEETLFGGEEAPAEAPAEAPTAEPVMEASAEPAATLADDAPDEPPSGLDEMTIGEDGARADVSLPRKEEVSAGHEKVPGAPVTSSHPPHTPVTERVDRPVSHEEHMKFIIKQFVYGLVAGVIIGFILGRVVSILLVA